MISSFPIKEGHPTATTYNKFEIDVENSKQNKEFEARLDSICCQENRFVATGSEKMFMNTRYNPRNEERQMVTAESVKQATLDCNENALRFEE